MITQLIYIAIFDDETQEPILSSLTEEGLLQALNDWHGIGVGKAEIIDDQQILYDSEFQGNHIRTIKYKDMFNDEEYINTIKVWCIEIS